MNTRSNKRKVGDDEVNSNSSNAYDDSDSDHENASSPTSDEHNIEFAQNSM